VRSATKTFVYTRQGNTMDVVGTLRSSSDMKRLNRSSHPPHSQDD
jgi:hypothetical protein